MCMSIVGEKLVNKALDKSPISRKLEEEYGIRPHGPAQMLGMDVGQGKNRFYLKGGRGYQDPRAHLTRPDKTLHVANIASRRAKG